jgi:hypothetical protein
VSADFESVKLPAKSRAVETKQKLLNTGNDRSPLRALLIEPSKVKYGGPKATNQRNFRMKKIVFLDPLWFLQCWTILSEPKQ